MYMQRGEFAGGGRGFKYARHVAFFCEFSLILIPRTFTKGGIAAGCQDFHKRCEEENDANKCIVNVNITEREHISC